MPFINLRPPAGRPLGGSSHTAPLTAVSCPLSEGHTGSDGPPQSAVIPWITGGSTRPSSSPGPPEPLPPLGTTPRRFCRSSPGPPPRRPQGNDPVFLQHGSARPHPTGTTEETSSCSSPRGCPPLTEGGLLARRPSGCRVNLRGTGVLCIFNLRNSGVAQTPTRLLSHLLPARTPISSGTTGRH